MIENPVDGNAERLDPCRRLYGGGDGYLGSAAHIKRYEFAAERVPAAAVVVDAACGTGYGSGRLALSASRVIGVDLSAEAVAYARQHYNMPNCEYLQGDVRDLSFLDSGTVDAVVSFETIEHLAEPEAFLLEVVRVLRPTGFLIVSTPHQLHTVRTPVNPHHRIEFGIQEFRELLSTHFSEVDILIESAKESMVRSLLKRSDILGLRHVARWLRRGAARRVPTPAPDPAVGGVTSVDQRRLDAAIESITIARSPLSTRCLATLAVCRGKR